MGSVETVFARDQLEESRDLLCETPLAAHSRPESRVIEPPAAKRFESAEDFFPTQRPMVQKPIVEEVANSVGQAEHAMSCPGRSRR